MELKLWKGTVQASTLVCVTPTRQIQLTNLCNRIAECGKLFCHYLYGNLRGLTDIEIR